MPNSLIRPSLLSLDGHQPLSIRARAMVFNDPQSLHLIDYVEKIAPRDVPVLIFGETGTGKELIARHIHQLSGRAGPFLAVNCGAITESLSESEFFGHEKGAFTGATTTHKGWFEAAQGGTLFLDEIGDLPLALQVKLLRVLQEREIVRIGSTKPIALDVRLLTGTNVDLQSAVQASRFRSDLLYRINIAQVTLPPLRERPGDILPLAKHFIDMYAARMDIESPELTDAAKQRLLSYWWPGNIRELENVIHFALLVSPQGKMDVSHLKLTPDTAQQPSVPQSASSQATTSPVSSPAIGSASEAVSKGLLASERLAANVRELMTCSEGFSLAEFEHLVTREAYQICHGNQVQTASLLGVSRNVVRTLLKRYGLL
jgi:DNA-binding NtrC family response regulator